MYIPDSRKLVMSFRESRKKVPFCEFFPIEAVRTNVIGTDNVLTAAIEAEVKSGICLSTDKATYQCHGHHQGCRGEGSRC